MIRLRIVARRARVEVNQVNRDVRARIPGAAENLLRNLTVFIVDVRSELPGKQIGWVRYLNSAPVVSIETHLDGPILSG